MLPVPLLPQMCRVHAYYCMLPSLFPRGFAVSTMLACCKCLGNITVISCLTLLGVWEKKLLTEVLCWYHRSDVHLVSNRATSRRHPQYHAVYCHVIHNITSVMSHLRHISSPTCYGTEAPSSGRHYNKDRPI